MGIRTRGFEKVSRNSSSSSKEKTSKEETAVKTEPKEETSTNAVVAKEVNTRSATANNKSIKKEASVPKSPVKLRTPATMARLGMKAAARKLKKHRKRRLFAQTASKILRSSIKTTKTRRPVRLEEKTRNTTAVPSRVSTRTLIRRTSREGIPEAPLRTVELIKRPLELREPATKLLYMASLGLYPRTGESDMTPIVVIRELNVSPGKKNGVRKSLELPLIPQYHKRVLDLANQNKNKVAETAKQTVKQPSKREARKSPPSSTIGEAGAIKKLELETNKKKVSSRSRSSLSPSLPSDTRSTVTQKPVTAGVKDNNNSSEVRKQQKLASPPPPSTNINALNILSSDIVASLIFNHTSTTVTPAKGMNLPTIADAGNILASNSKSLLKSNLSPPSNKSTRVASPSSFTSSMFKLPTNVSLQSDLRQTADSLLNNSVTLSDAMSLFMPNITILPTPTPTSSGSRKRPAATNSQISNSIEATNLTVQNYGERKPPKKKPKNMVEENVPRHSLSLPPSVQVSVSRPSYNDNAFLKDLTPIQNTDEALNLCMKKRLSDPPTMANMSKLCAKPENNNNNNNNGVLNYDIKVNGPKPLNLIIPRPPPPLTKAPMEITNIANCSQNVHPAAPPKPKSQSVKAKKSRQNHNQLSQSNLQLQQILPSVLPLVPEATVHAKSLLKCMNGEENTCVREIGESLDSVKTMLARLQTRIGPAVNGVRLITIE